MAVTRINNNQISDASAGNVYLGINAASKLQAYSITSTKLANNLTYGSDLTVTGNLTIQGNTTTIDTTYTTVEDPILLLASNQTGAPALDIGFVGQRGTSQNIAFVWDESAGQFVTAYTTTGESNTTISIASYADLHVGNANIGGNIVINGTTSQVGNILGNLNVSGNIAGGNLLTPGIVSADGNILGANFNTAGIVSATGNIVSSANINATSAFVNAGAVLASGRVEAGTSMSAAGNITGGNILTGGLISSTGNITSAANVAGGNLLATSNVNAVGGYFTGNVTVIGNLNATVGIVYANAGVFFGATPTGNGAIYAGISGYTPLGSNVVAQFAGNANSYSQINFQNISASSSASTDYIATADNGSDTTYYVDVGINSSTFDDQTNYPGFGPNDSYVHNHGGNLILNPETSGKVIKFMVGGTGNAQVVANVTSTGITSGGTFSAAGNITSASNVAGGNLIATTIVSGASILGTIVSASANVTGGNVLTGGLISATGNITSAANVLGGNLVATTAVVTPTVIGTTVTISSTGGLITLAPSSNVSVNSKYINDLAQPVQDNDAASKIYVDNMVSTQIAYHSPVVAATTGTLETATGGTITYTQPNGAGNGVGALLTVSGGSFNLIDTANIQTVGARVLVKDQANAALNGVYTWANATNLVRSTDADAYGPDSSETFSINDYFFVSSGNVNAGSAWVVNAPSGTITFGTSNITFAQFSSSQTYTAGNGISLVGTVITAKTDNNTTAFDGSGNIIVKAGANLTTPNIGAATGTSLSVTGNLTGAGANISGNVSGGNILTAGVVSSTGNITSAANISGGNLLTGGLISSTGNITSAANVAGGNLVATTIVSGASVLGTIVSASANITGGNILTGGLISATGNITSAANVAGGNLVATTIVSGASLIGTIVSASANITGGNILTGGLISATGNITSAANVAGGNVISSANVVTVGVSASGNITGGNVLTGGLISATGNITSAANVAGGNVIATTIVSGASLIGTLASLSGNITGANINTGGSNGLTLNASTINSNAARITVNSNSSDVDFAVNGSTANVLYIDAGTSTASFGSSTQITNALVSFNSNRSILMPVGTTSERPGTGVTGMLRFNSTLDAVEVYDADGWTTVGTPSFTVVSDQQFNGDGATVAFTLANAATTNSTIISINGVVQVPTIAYSVSSTTLTFTEAPQTGDLIDVRNITTTTQVTSISNSPGNAIVQPNATVGIVEITGDLNPVSNVTQSLGNTTNRWKDLYVGGNTITMGNVVMKNVAGGNTIGFYGPDGTTPATIASTSIDTTTISNGTSNVAVASSGGNVRVNVGGTSNVAVFDSTGLVITGNLSVSGNATLSGNILGDRVQNGTTSFDIQTASGNANITVGGTSNVAVFTTDGVTITGNITNGGSNGVGNIGSSTTYFNTVFAKATSAQYADLAENYVADAEYEPGTVLSFGGEHEVTVSSTTNDQRIAGVVSTNPSYVMNATLEGEYVATIALTGRVPTKVSGPVAKGDMMISAGNGRAIACATPTIGTVIGKALESNPDQDGVIEVVVGRL